MVRVAFALIMGLAFTLSSAVRAEEEAGGKKGKKEHKGVHGVVVDVKKDGDKDAGYIVVKVHAKKGSAEGAREVKFKVTDVTKFEKVTHISKGNNKIDPATFQDIAKGEHVHIVGQEGDKDAAKLVAIVIRDKSGKKTAANPNGTVKQKAKL
jgi:hypothetical protein